MQSILQLKIFLQIKDMNSNLFYRTKKIVRLTNTKQRKKFFKIDNCYEIIRYDLNIDSKFVFSSPIIIKK
jgi:hypothetical protein